MDLIYQRYSNPHIILNEMISHESFGVFIDKLLDKCSNENLLKIYLSNNPYNELTFNEWKESLIPQTESAKSLESTIKDSSNILKGFKPTQ